MRRRAYELREAVERLEPAFALDPPAPPDILPWKRPPSRWHEAATEDSPERGDNSKKYVLPELPEDWDGRLWSAAVNVDWPRRDVLAVHLTIPVRSEDIVPGQRPSGWSPAWSCVYLNHIASNSRSCPRNRTTALYGTELTTIIIDPTIADEPAKFLAERCRLGGEMVVSIEAKNAVRKRLPHLAERLCRKRRRRSRLP